MEEDADLEGPRDLPKAKGKNSQGKWIFLYPIP